MRILWVSDSPTTPSGFGGVTNALCKRLAARGHAVEILGWQTHSAPSYWDGIPVRPVRRDAFGGDVLHDYLMRIRPQVVITLADVWWMTVMLEPAIQRYLDLSGARWLLYYPLDGADENGELPPSWRKILAAADVRMAMSRFGVEVTRRCGLDCDYLPHGCDLDLFRPPADKRQAKARWGYEDKFVVLSDARNQPRKLLPRTLDVAAQFARGKRDVVVHLHTDPADQAATSDLYCYRVLEDVKAMGLEDVVRFTPSFRMRAKGGIPIEDLASLYAASDAHLLCSWGEGFGLPNLQSAAAGVVPMAVAYSASHELVDPHGYAIPAESAILDEFGLVRCLLSRELAAAALDELYQDRAQLAARSQASREFALAYDWDAIACELERIVVSAPPRLRQTRSRVVTMTSGKSVTQSDDPVALAMTDAMATLPDGAKMSVRVAERRSGEAALAIRSDAFVRGDELSIPVRLAPAFERAPRARVGHVMVSPADLPLAATLKHLFPNLGFSVPRPDGNPESREQLPIEQLLPALLHVSLVLDTTATAARGLDVACAAAGIPYLGTSMFWPPIDLPTPLEQARRLLTDQGFSEWRRGVALSAVVARWGADAVETLRGIALEGQPEKPRSESRAKPPDLEMYLVRARRPEDARVNGHIAEYVAQKGGLVLMATDSGSLIVTLPNGKDVLAASPLVDFVGGINLDEKAEGARALKQHFAMNAAKQLIAQGQV